MTTTAATNTAVIPLESLPPFRLKAPLLKNAKLTRSVFLHDPFSRSDTGMISAPSIPVMGVLGAGQDATRRVVSPVFRDQDISEGLAR